MGRKAAPRERLREAFRTHLEKATAWLERQPNVAMLRVSYSQLYQAILQQAIR